MGRIIKLMYVGTDGQKRGNNKFYEMSENGDGTWTATYGRYGTTGSKETYPMEKIWDRKYKEKIKKGYKDVTELVTVVSGSGQFAAITDQAVARIVERLQQYAKTTVTANYNVEVRSVTQAQVDAAQELIDRLVDTIKHSTLDQANRILMELYTVIPRRMNRVQDHLLVSLGDLNDKDDPTSQLVDSEQSILDTMAGQVLQQTALSQSGASDTVLSALGLQIVPVNAQEIEKIRMMLGPNAHQFRSAYKVQNARTEAAFSRHVAAANNKAVNLFWHGSRNENWWNIVQTGLLIRPAGAVYTGSMFGDGIYFADKAQKSIGYTSLRGARWTSGSANDAYVSLYAVHQGRAMEILHHNSSHYRLCERELRSQGYDSVFAKGGADLVNNEYIVYNGAQSTVRYLVQIG